MSSHMDLESAGSHELVIAHFADVWSLPRMASFVICQVTLGREVHVTVCEITLERLLTIVYPHMRE